MAEVIVLLKLDFTTFIKEFFFQQLWDFSELLNAIKARTKALWLQKWQAALMEKTKDLENI